MTGNRLVITPDVYIVPLFTELIGVSDSLASGLIRSQLALLADSAPSEGWVKKAPEAQQDEQHK